MGYRLARFFIVRHCGDLNKIVEAMAPANPYDNQRPYKCKVSHNMQSGLMSFICGLNL